MARRGFFAELNYQSQQAEKRHRQQAAAAYRAQAAAQREAERAWKAAERAQAAAARGTAAQQKEAAKEAARTHVEARGAEVAAMPESRGDGWVADVLATKDGHRIAFEVQWSAQTRDEYQHRQERYQAGGVRCAWFTRHERSVPQPNGALPVFLLTAHGDDMTVWIAERTWPLADAVTALLGGRVKYRDYRRRLFRAGPDDPGQALRAPSGTALAR